MGEYFFAACHLARESCKSNVVDSLFFHRTFFVDGDEADEDVKEFV